MKKRIISSILAAMLLIQGPAMNVTAQELSPVTVNATESEGATGLESVTEVTGSKEVTAEAISEQPVTDINSDTAVPPETSVQSETPTTESTTTSEPDIETVTEELVIPVQEGVAYEGYLVKVKEGVAQPEETSNIESISEELYVAQSKEEVLSEFKASEIEYIEPNYKMDFLADPDDTYYSQQKTYFSNVGAQELWNNNMDGTGATIAVLDSGLVQTHEDLNYSNILSGKNYYDDSTNTVDTLGHGTQITGILSAIRNNGKGIAGLLSGAKIVPLKISDASNQVSLEAVVKAIYGAVDDYKVQVISMSIGMPVASTALEDAVNYAASKGTIMVAAVGNGGTSELLYPAAYSNVIGVGAVDNTNVVRSSSQKNESVFVTAPGENIYFTTLENKYVYSSGTSYAAPFVAAMAAAAKSVTPDMTIDQFKVLLKKSSVDTGTTGYDTSYGNGIINIASFLGDINTQTTESVNLVIKKQKADGTSLATDEKSIIKKDGAYSISAPTVEKYTPVSYKIEGALTTGLNTTYEIGKAGITSVSYSDISNDVTSITYIYEKVKSTGTEPAIEFTSAGNYGGLAADAFNDMVLTSDGGFVAVGYTLGKSENPAWDFITSGSYSYNDAIVVKFDAQNQVEWAKSYGTTGTDVLSSVAQLKDGTIVAVGWGPHAFTEGGAVTASGYVLKINPKDPTDYKEIYLGGTKGDYLHAVVATKDGGYAVAGRSASIDSATWKDVRASQTTQDGVIAKFDANDTLKFSACYNRTGTYLSRFYDMEEDADGNLIVVGDHQVAKFLYNSQIVKYNGETGAVLWSKSAGTSRTVAASSVSTGHTSSYEGITVLTDGTYVATGVTKYTGSDTGENWGITGTQDGTIVHYASDGTVISGKNIGTIGGSIFFNGATATSDGGYVIYGSTSNTVQETNVPYSWDIAGAQDAIILKYDAEDELKSSKSYGSTGNDYFYAIQFNDSGEAVAVGESNSTGGALNLSNNGSTDALVYTNRGISATKEITIKYQSADGRQIQEDVSHRLSEGTNYQITVPEIANYKATGFQIAGAQNAGLNGTYSLDGTMSTIPFGEITSGTTTITYLYQKIDTQGLALTYADGTYQDSAQGYGGKIKVSVTITGGAISGVEVLSHTESNILGTDYMAKASNGTIPNIISKQSTEVDSVSGATVTSVGLKNAVANCLSQAKAATVVSIINNIKLPITKDSKDELNKAQNIYYMLDSYGRSFVTNYSSLRSYLDTVNGTVSMTGISMNISEVSLVKGESKKLTVTVIPANTTDDTTLTYSSSNGAVASVSADGTITANTCGSAVVTASVGGFTATCNVTVPHTYGNEQIIKQATLSSDGSMGKICTSDGDVLITSTIYSISSITLNQPILTYTGKNQTPTVIVKDRNGNVISPEYFSVTFPSKSKAIGSYSAQVTFSGKYSGSKNLSYTIGPKVPKAKLSGATKKSMVVKWKKISGVNGYEVQYSTTSNFETYKKTTTTSVSKTISKLTKKKKYYVRVRSYKTVKVNKVSIKIYSNWSDVKSLTTKK